MALKHKGGGRFSLHVLLLEKAPGHIRTIDEEIVYAHTWLFARVDP